LMALHMLEVDSDAQEGTTDSADGTDEVGVGCAAGSEFLGLLGLVKCTLIVTSHDNRTHGNLMEGAKPFNCHQKRMETLQLRLVGISLRRWARNMCDATA